MPQRKSGRFDKRYNEIKKLIYDSGREGISQKALREEFNIPRTSANRYCKRLEKERIISAVKEGTGKRYFARSEIVMDPEIGAYVQGRHAYYKLIRRGQIVPINPECLTINWDKMSDLEVGLFNFSSTMGALLTYILLHVMIQGNPILYREYNRKGSYYLKNKRKHMTNRRKDQLVRQWIDGFLSGILTSAPYTFRELVLKKTGYYPAHTKDRVKVFDRKKPRLYIYDPEIIRLGEEAFRNIYPNISKILSRISTQLPGVVDSQKASFEAFEKSGRSSLNERLAEEKLRKKEKRRAKQAHDHKFILSNVKAGVKYFECKICGEKESELTRTL